MAILVALGLAGCGGGGGSSGSDSQASFFTIGGTISGLVGTAVLQNNGGDNLSVSASGTFTFRTSIGNGSAYTVTVRTQPTGPSQTCAVSNGSGSVGGANVTNVAVVCATNTYTISGSISGLAGTGLTLRNNGGNDLAIPANATAFTFATPVASGATYAVSVSAQPGAPSQTCTVSNGSGSVGSGNVGGVAIACETNTYTIGGTVSGLEGAGLVLRNNGGDDLAVPANATAFTFTVPVASGAAYAVSVATQPNAPSQTCTVSNGSASVGGAAVGDVAITCTTNLYTIGGAVSGLAGAGLVLRNNGNEALAVPANATTFAFSVRVASGAPYAVTVSAQPGGPSQTCTVSAGSGTVGSSNIGDVVIACTTNSYTIGGTISGLAGAGLELRNNGGNAVILPANATSFVFGTPVASGATYAVTVFAQPVGPSQTCTVGNGTGSVGGGNVNSVAITCTTNTYTIGGTISGLAGAGLVLRNNGGDDLAVAPGATAFTFGTPIASGATYAVTVFTQPAGPTQVCTVSNGSGTVAAGNIAAVAVLCAAGSNFSIATVADPLALQQWHLRNTGQTAYSASGGVPGMDINVDPVYSSLGIAGSGVTVAVVDTGLQITHEDLAANVVAGGSWNFINGTTDPTNTEVDPFFGGRVGDHGTGVAGLIAMARNAVGGIGVASAARLKGFNALQSQTLANFVSALGGSSSNPNSADVFVFNQSYGQNNSEDILIDSVIADQYLAAVTNLRGGKGALFAKAAGNGFVDMGELANLNCQFANEAGVSCQNANFDPENATPYLIVVGAIDASGVKSSYSSAGSAIWVSAPGGEFGTASPAMITADQSNCSDGYSQTIAASTAFDGGAAPNTECNYMNTFNGTSSAAPVTAGVVALLLQANPALTWRDVKHILASTARQVDATVAAVGVALAGGIYVAEPAWTTNAAGFKFHNGYGFGLVDAAAAVNMARNNYTLLAPFRSTALISSAALSLAIADNDPSGVTSSLTVPAGTVQVVEAVQISVSATHTYSGDIGIELVSPSGTRSVLKNIRDGFDSSPNLDGMVLLSNAFYGEGAVGTWTLRVVDGNGGDIGTLTGWTLRVFGR